MATATVETYTSNQLYSIPLANLQPDPNQPRKYFDPAALDELTASISRNGVMSPVLFRVQDGTKFIVAGERRCLAARNAGLTSIPALYVDAANYDEISLIDNMVRSDLNPVELAEAMDARIQAGVRVRGLFEKRGSFSEKLAFGEGDSNGHLSLPPALSPLPV